MGDHETLSFKISLYRHEYGSSGGLTKQEVRRLAIDREVSTSFKHLKEKLVNKFPVLLSPSEYSVMWKDSDKELIIIEDNDDLKIALADMKGPVYYLDVQFTSRHKEENSGRSIGNNVSDIELKWRHYWLTTSSRI